MGQRGTWEVPRGPTRQAHHVQARPAHGARPALVWGPHGPPLIPLSPILPSFTSKHFPIVSNPSCCCCSSRIFDLLAYSIFLAEIWSISSPVCDSSAYPNRFLFSGVYLEYFAAVGDMLIELACLDFACISCFDAWFSSPTSSYSVLPYLFVAKSLFMRVVKNFRNGAKCTPTISAWTWGRRGHEGTPWRRSLRFYHGIDLHLGQKPKLGGRYADDSLIYISYFVGSLYIHISLSFVFVSVFVLFLFLFSSSLLFLLSKTQKDQKYFCCFSWFASLVSEF